MTFIEYFKVALHVEIKRDSSWPFVAIAYCDHVSHKFCENKD